MEGPRSRKFIHIFIKVNNLKDMYKIVAREHTNWGISGYQVPKDYFDAVKHKEQRLIEDAQLKRKNHNETKLKLHITKRGSYIEDELKLQSSKDISPLSYKLIDTWDRTAEAGKNVTKKAVAHRETYIDSIFKEHKLRPTPAPNAYGIVLKSDQ